MGKDLVDKWFLLAVMGLVILGLLMVTSASIVISEKQYGSPFHYIVRQACFLGVGALVGLFILRFDLKLWEKISPYLLIVSLILLVAVLVPGIGHQVNGSRRWLSLGFIGFQPSELAKFAFILYLAGYLVRRREEVCTQIRGFMKPMALLTLIAVLLLLEPDFGSTIVIFATALFVMFLAGVPVRYFIALGAAVICAMVGIAVSSPYRVERLTSFLNPWANQFDSGYQLTQSLIAFGRGGWFGVGLGDSVQKLFYLPEAHTDFLFAVLSEELGLAGALTVILLFMLLVWRTLRIGRQAQSLKRHFAAYVAYGSGLWLGLQAVINIGVNTGALPTKGLTLPLMSYGGSSLLIVCVVVALILRIDIENRFERLRAG